VGHPEGKGGLACNLLNGRLRDMAEKSRSKSTVTDSPNRPKLERMHLIHMHLREGLNAKHLNAASAQKKNASFFANLLETSAKTIRRDIEFMRERMGLPIEYDESLYTYFYTREVTDFPLLKITEGELTALFVAKAALHQYKGAPYESALRSALEKLESGLKSEMDVDLDAIDRAISFRNAGSPVPDMKTFELLADAVMHRKIVRFTYRKSSGESSVRIVRPYHLAHYGTRWYLLSPEDADAGTIKQFNLRQISRVEVMSKRFAPPVGFTPENYYQNAFGIFVSGEAAQEVRLKFTGSASEIVQEGDWHPTQKFVKKKDGSVEMTFTVSSFDEVAKWVLSFGGEAEAVAPLELREKVRKLAKQVTACHERRP
jgi:predicted DNA-binding transcriptional regulator YafY